MFYTKFASDEEILYFLSKNTANIFLYDLSFGRGPSSVIDYALSVNTPLCINDSYMFNHIYNDDICVCKNSIQKCINNSHILDLYRKKWCHNKLVEKLNQIIEGENGGY
jgi:hypothetical protein